MTPNKVVILTHSGDDFCVLPIIKAIEEQGGIPIRFNCDDYPGKLQLEFSYSNQQPQHRLFDGQQWHDMREVKSIWVRRFVSVGARALADMPEKYRSAALQEADRSLSNFFYSLRNIPQYNIPELRPIFYSKEYQLEMAAELGWRIPETRITNSPDSVRELLQRYPQGIIAKPHTSYFIDYEQQKGATLFATLVHPDQIDQLDGIAHSPMIFQEPIPKKVELRIPVVGDQLWAYSIDSQSNDSAKMDWRRAGLEMIRQWQPFDLPEEVRARIFALTKRLGCTYGSLDVIVTPNNEFVFLEINTDGEFFWLDELSGFAISKAWATLLLS